MRYKKQKCLAEIKCPVRRRLVLACMFPPLVLFIIPWVAGGAIQKVCGELIDIFKRVWKGEEE